jgi:hypothetical protein
MLGWDVHVYRHDQAEPEHLLASWKTSAFGLKWIDELVAQGRAKDHGGSGYPCIFTMGAAVFLAMTRGGLPRNGSPLTVGENYLLPPGWSGEVAWNAANLAACTPEEELLIYAWDQS